MIYYLKYYDPTSETNIEKELYYTLAVLSIIAHIAHTFLFFYMKFFPLVYFNLAVISIYSTIAFPSVKNEHYAAFFMVSHLEIIAYVLICAVFVGWALGSTFALFVNISFIFSRPFKRGYIVTILAMTEIFLFVALFILHDQGRILYVSQSLFEYQNLIKFTGYATISFCLYSVYMIISKYRKQFMVSNRQLKKVADYDELTGLKTRKAFIEDVRCYLAPPPPL